MDKKDRPYSVLPHDPSWRDRYERERKVLSRVFQEKALRIEHVGSTSVEGLWAKPQIDILVMVRDFADVQAVRPALEDEGYACIEEFEQYGERYFVRDAEDGERLVSVHIREESDPGAFEQIKFRDYLREHAQARDAYSAVKKRAFENGVDRVRYSEEKRQVLLDIKNKAEEWFENREG